MHNFNVYEAVMLVCFGTSWPFALLKTIRVKNPTGKSLLFMYLILIGYISTINKDTNNLTKSGYLTPVVDFEHLSEVLVITDKKQQIPSGGNMDGK